MSICDKEIYLLLEINILNSYLFDVVIKIIMQYLYLDFDSNMLAYNLYNNIIKCETDEELLNFYKRYAKIDTNKWTSNTCYQILRSSLYHDIYKYNMCEAQIIYGSSIDDVLKYLEIYLKQIKPQLLHYKNDFIKMYLPPKPKISTWIDFCLNITSLINQSITCYIDCSFITNKYQVVKKIRKLKSKKDSDIKEINIKIKYTWFYSGYLKDIKIDDAYEEIIFKMNRVEFIINSLFPTVVENKLSTLPDNSGILIDLSIKRYE